jgi:hypothetical protein
LRVGGYFRCGFCFHNAFRLLMGHDVKNDVDAERI